MELRLIQAHVTKGQASEQTRRQDQYWDETSKDDELGVVFLFVSLGEGVHRHGVGLGIRAGEEGTCELRRIVNNERGGCVDQARRAGTEAEGGRNHAAMGERVDRETAARPPRCLIMVRGGSSGARPGGGDARLRQVPLGLAGHAELGTVGTRHNCGLGTASCSSHRPQSPSGLV